jgi:hypothetical protein
VTGQLVELPRRDGHDPELTYKQLALELGVSKRFLQLRAKEGMPSSGFNYRGERLFPLSEAKAFLDSRQERLGRTLRGARSPLPSREAS